MPTITTEELLGNQTKKTISTEDLLGQQENIPTKAEKPKSWLSEITRMVMRGSPLEQLKTSSYQYGKLTPETTYEDIDKLTQQREQEIIGGGTLPQLEAPITAGLAVAGAQAPLEVIKGLGRFFLINKIANKTGLNLENLAEKTNAPETIKDIAQVSDVALQGIVAGGLTKENLFKVPKIREMAQKQATTKADNAIVETFNKAIKPSAKGKSTPAQRQTYYKDAQTAIKDIVANKENLKDIEGNPLENLPQGVSELSQATKSRMDDLFAEWKGLEQAAIEGGAKPSLHTPVNEILNKFVNNPAYKIRPEIQSYAQKLATRLWQTPRDITAISEQIKILNDTASRAYGDPASIGKAQVDAVAAKALRSMLDNTIEGSKGKGWQDLRNKYKAYKTIEKDVNNAVIREAKKLNPGGLNDLLSTFGDSDIVAGLITLNPGWIIRGVAQRSALGFMKWLNNPNRRIQSMFNQVEKATLLSNTSKQIEPELIPIKAKAQRTLNPNNLPRVPQNVVDAVYETQLNKIKKLDNRGSISFGIK